jgi:peptidoglycan L-alanyl-D-glutamate endopeptidase CwlK
MNVKSDVWFGQRLLSSCGLYTDKIDGVYGKNTAAAEAAFNKLFIKYADQYGRFDDRTETNIGTLLPKAQIAARKAMVAVAALGGGLTVKILSGTRTYAEQTALYAQGRTRPGGVVTKAKAGQSNHNFGIAFDIGIFKGSKYYEGKNAAEEKAYVDASKLIKPVGLDWGGDWKSIKDTPHYELHTGMSVTQVRNLLEAGKPYV